MKTYNVIILPHFRKQLKPLAKKYPSLKEAFIESFNDFIPRNNTALGRNLYKVRLSPKELNKGKSKGLRCIVLCVEQDGYIVPVTIYAKAEKANTSVRELETHTEMILVELAE
jgi:mRNA-degrading endonuclease RelE of RelBE toxin-antitoxin system